jgi:hypothetical protein
VLEKAQDEFRLTLRIASCQLFDLTFSYQVERFNSFQSSCLSIKHLKAL